MIEDQDWWQHFRSFTLPVSASRSSIYQDLFTPNFSTCGPILLIKLLLVMHIVAESCAFDPLRIAITNCEQKRSGPLQLLNGPHRP